MQTDPPNDTDAGERLDEALQFGSPMERRKFLALSGGAGVSFALWPLLEANAAEATPATSGSVFEVTLQINGQTHRLQLDPRVTLLDALRDRLQLTGTKKGCDHGQCGACTVLLNGRRVNACLLLAATCEGDRIVTIEGLGTPEQLHPMQAAFLAQDGFQCGYCTPGQICSAVACVHEGHAGDEEQLREFMSGNLCRCGAYANIRAAILAARTATAALPTP